MATETDYGQFTPAERRAALVQLTSDILTRIPPVKYPPNAQGEQRKVKPGSEPNAAAIWAARALDCIEYVARPQERRGTAREGGSNGPF